METNATTRTRTVAVAGNPNSGKTTLFNGLTGSKQRLGNWPGIYSLSASSEDEIVARSFLLSADVDLVVNIVDASNLQRNLYLTLQLGEVSHFIMELPPYHAPRGLHILSHAFERLNVFVYRAGVTITIIVAILSVVNWPATVAPRQPAWCLCSWRWGSSARSLCRSGSPRAWLQLPQPRERLLVELRKIRVG